MATSKPKTMSSKDRAFYTQYSKDMYYGRNNLSNKARYDQLTKLYGEKKRTIGTSALQNMSVRALNGDKQAQDYLKRMSFNPLKGKSLWSGYDSKNLKEGTAAYNQHRADNPLSELAKGYDMKQYDRYTGLIKDNKPMTDAQNLYYSKLTEKWNMDDMNDPFIQQKHALRDAEKAQMSAQDQSLNNSMATLDANNFQRFQELNQSMANRGISGSGIAADAATRMQMGANRDYQDAFVQATQNKADIQNNFIDRQAEVTQRMQDQENKEQQLILDAQQMALTDKKDMLTLSQKQDEFLTTSTGFVHMDGKRLTMNGQPISTVELMKLSETQRHNVATENNISAKNLMTYQLGLEKNAISREGNMLDYQVGMDKNAVSREGNQLDYAYGMDKNAVAREKISADTVKAMKRLELDYAKLDFDYEKLESNNRIAQENIKIAAANAQTSKDKNQITALGAKSKTLADQIVAIQKKKKPTDADKKALKKLVKQYNETNNAISDIVGGESFRSSGGGGGKHTLGSLSKKYESGSSGAGTIGNNSGDWGGKSYGTYQIATNTGTMNSFMAYLKGSDPSVYKTLSAHKVGSSGFDKAWKRLASTQNSRFDGLQHAFIKRSHYDPAASKMKASTGIDPNKRSAALQNVIWSMGVQHGAGGANSIFRNAGITKGMSDKQIITRLYNERMKVDKYFSRSSSSIKKSVKSRFQRELSDALRML